tara:strand:+ start:1181 stop:2110 length:930 start_codon:yes stop_codon:yes gene_type:complete
MIFTRDDIIKKYPWINQSKQRFIVSADYDGLICASLLNHYKKWNLVGYYNLESIWISDEAKKYKDDIIWVDLNILPHQGRAVGGHIISIKDESPKGFDTSCNPNILAGLNSSMFKKKFPLSTLLFLLWLYNIQISKTILSKMLVLHSDSSWLKAQNYNENFNLWTTALCDYDWKWLFRNVLSKTFEKRIDDILYPELSSIYAISGYSKLKSKNLYLQSRELKVNPDWDEDVIHNLFEIFATNLKWTPPKLPEIISRVDGKKNKIALKDVKKNGLLNFLKKEKIFSYTITSPQTLTYTSFGSTLKSPIKK